MDIQQPPAPMSSGAAPAPARPTAVTVVMVLMWIAVALTILGALLGLLTLGASDELFGEGVFSKTSYTIQYVLNLVIGALLIYALLGMRKRSLRAFYVAIGVLVFNFVYSLWPALSILGLIISAVLIFFLWREKRYFTAP